MSHDEAVNKSSQRQVKQLLGIERQNNEEIGSPAAGQLILQIPVTLFSRVMDYQVISIMTKDPLSP